MKEELIEGYAGGLRDSKVAYTSHLHYPELSPIGWIPMGKAERCNLAMCPEGKASGYGIHISTILDVTPVCPFILKLSGTPVAHQI
jgi:hypothetical protein